MFKLPATTLILISEPATELVRGLRARASKEGLRGIRITSAQLAQTTGERLEHFIASGFHGDMAWMADTTARRKSPDAMWPEAKSAVLFALPYGQALDPMQRLTRKSTGTISVYALNRDYHDVLKGKLKRLAHWFHHASGAEVKIFTDTAPLMEKPLGEQAGLGWQGKHTNLVSRELGSWFFIGTLLTSMELPNDPTEIDHCGTCTACLDICPTRAFPAPRQLDARRCISYLTIEHKSHIAREFRKPMGNRIYGCDDCLAVCPWNKFAALAGEAKLAARAELIAPSLQQLLALDDVHFRQLFSGSPVKRIGRDRFIRNCLIAAGNSGDASLVATVKHLLSDASPLVRAMAVWALRQLSVEAEFVTLRQQHKRQERDGDVMLEWTEA